MEYRPNRFHYAAQLAYGRVRSNHGSRPDTLYAFVAGLEPERIEDCERLTSAEARRLFGAAAVASAQQDGSTPTHLCYDRRHCPDRGSA